MVGFFIKKNFFDGWDNLIQLCILNIFFLIITFLFFTLSRFAAVHLFVFLAAGFCFCMVLGIILLAVSNMTAQTANYTSFSVKEMITELPQVWKHGALFGSIEYLFLLTATLVIPYYFSIPHFIGLLLGMFTVWVCIIVQLSLCWFLPIRSQLEKRFTKCIKKCFILFFDNTRFTLFMVVYSIFLLAITPFLAFLAPGMSGLLLAWNNAFKLRMYKYDWIEQHPEIPIAAARKQIPWDELLEHDRDTIGHRSIRNLIFPWKD